jgi:hypothetical protein
MVKWFLIGLFVAAPTFAQQLSDVTKVERIIASDKSKLGWIPKLNIGANLSFASNSNVVGQTNGDSQTYGLNFKGELSHVAQLTEWRNTLTVLESTSKTASLPDSIKTGDDFKYETVFLYSLPSIPQIGPYAKGIVETALFRGEDVRDSVTTYNIHHIGGAVDTFNGQKINLTDSFRPLTTKESAGFFWKAVQQDNMNLELNLGLGALQVAADGQFAVGGKNATGAIDINELHSFTQAGVELGANFKGKIDEKSGYEVSADILSPFVTSRQSGDTRSDSRLTNYEFGAKLTSKVTSWASFSYDYKLKYQPLLVERGQSAHLLVLNINYNIF